MTRRLLQVLFAVAVAGGCAQKTSPPDPTAPRAKAPPLEYRSAFVDYRPFADEPIAPWRGANETVKEAAEPAKPQPGQQHRGHR